METLMQIAAIVMVSIVALFPPWRCKRSCFAESLL